MLNKVADNLLALPRTGKRGLALSVDAFVCGLCVWIAFGLRLDTWDLFTKPRLVAAGAAVAIALPIFVITGFYRAIFRFSGAAALFALGKACALFGVFYFVVFTLVGVSDVPRSVGINVPLLLITFIGGSRLVARYWLGGAYVGILERHRLPQVVIYGAGAAGRQLAAALGTSREMVLRAFVDDSPELQGASLNGVSIYASSKLEELVAERGITDLLLAMPSVDPSRRAEIVRLIEELKMPLHVRTLPDLLTLAKGQIQPQDLHELEIEDLLGRDTVPPRKDLLLKNIANKIVLVTGAGGSIGSELCRQIIGLRPQVLLLVESSEYALYSIYHELSRIVGADGPRVLPLLANVRDEPRLREIIQTWRPHTVYHAAAYKHVPLVEHNPAEGVRNNVFGTLVTARLAAEHGVDDFVLVSTDKAVRPTNIMGASKRLAEMVLQGLALRKQGNTRFSMVRFGNVLGSSGSVVPLFRQQIREGGPITLTHADITRYFMTIPEAAQLVLQAGAMAQGGEVFVLDMGSPVRIIDLARRMVELSGLKVRDEENADGDIAITITGLRPGEKLYEELLIGDNPAATEHPRIMKANDDALCWEKLTERLGALELALSLNNVDMIRQMLVELVSGYRPAGDIVDWVHVARIEELAVNDSSKQPNFQKDQCAMK